VRLFVSAQSGDVYPTRLQSFSSRVVPVFSTYQTSPLFIEVPGPITACPFPFLVILKKAFSVSNRHSNVKTLVLFFEQYVVVDIQLVLPAVCYVDRDANSVDTIIYKPI